MSPKRIAVVPRPGYNKYGFKIKKTGGAASGHGKVKPAQTAAQFSKPTAQAKQPETMDPCAPASKGSSRKAPAKLTAQPKTATKLNYSATPVQSQVLANKKCSGCKNDTAKCQLKVENTAPQRYLAFLPPSVPAPLTALTSPAARHATAKSAAAPVAKKLLAAAPKLASASLIPGALAEAVSSNTTATPRANLATTASISTDILAGSVESVARPVSEALTEAGDDDIAAEAIRTGTQRPTVGLAIRSSTSQTLHEASVKSTPAYIRQIREAAQSPDSSLGQAECVVLDVEARADSTHPSKTIFQVEEAEDSAGIEQPRREPHSGPPLAPTAGSADVIGNVLPAGSVLQVNAESVTAEFTLTSTLLRLVASKEGNDEYVFTTTYRVPKTITFRPPQVSFLLPSGEPSSQRTSAAATAQSSKNSKKRSRPDKFDVSVADELNNDAAQGRGDEVVEERRVSRRRLMKGCTPTRFHRGNPPRRLTPSRLVKTPVRKSTPVRRSTPASSTPRTRPAIFNSTTIRRKAQWKKTMANMAEYQRRRALFPRRPAFQQAVQEKAITLPRLETFWTMLSDLVAKKKLFNRGPFDHWESVGTCTRLINARLAAQDAFGVEESCAAARELMRQRMVMLAGGDRLMLTRNALSTRRS